jgi:hypothetical protein
MSLTTTQLQMLEVIAQNDDKQQMCAIFATALLIDDAATVKHIATHYTHMFNEQQRAAAKEILAAIVQQEQFEQSAATLATHTIEQAMMH